MNLHNEFDPILDDCLYYDLDELNKIPKENGNLSLLHLNIASLALHFDELHTLLATSNNKFDIIGITETGFKKNQAPMQNFQIKGYSHTDCTTESNKGGVRLYISEKFDYKIRTDLKLYKSKELESVFIEIINKNGKNYIISCIYKHPKLPIDEFNYSYLKPTLEKLTTENKNIFILGDFNINLMNFDSNSDCENFLELTSSNSLIPLILKPTRITAQSKTN